MHTIERDVSIAEKNLRHDAAIDKNCFGFDCAWPHADVLNLDFLIASLFSFESRPLR